MGVHFEPVTLGTKKVVVGTTKALAYGINRPSCYGRSKPETKVNEVAGATS